MELNTGDREDWMRNTVLVSNLALFTGDGAVIKHFADFGQVEKLAFIHANDLTYTRACKVKLQSVDSVTKILETPHHVIDGREVTVEKYLGGSEHQWLFYKGKFKLILKGLDVNQTDYSLYTYLETAFAKCGRYSEICLRKKPNGSLKGVAEIYFIKKKDIPKAFKVAREELKLKAKLARNDKEHQRKYSL